MANTNLSYKIRPASSSAVSWQSLPWLIVLLVCAGAVNSFGQKPLSANNMGKSQTAHDSILFTDSQAAVLQANAAAGLPAPVAQGGKLAQPLGICLGANGELFVTDTGSYALVGIDPSTGNQRTVSSGGLLGVPFGVAAEAQGTLLVANAQVLLRIDSETGAQKVLSAAGFFRAPLAVTVAQGGEIYVVDALGSIIRVDPASGAQTLVATGGYLKRPQGIAVFGNSLYVTDVATADGNFGIGRIIQLDRQTGAQKVVSEGNYLVGPVGITVGAGGDLVVGDPYTINEQSPNLFDGGIIHVDRTTGAQSLVARGEGNFVNPRGVAIVR